MRPKTDTPPRATIYDVAQAAGVSAATVSRVLAGRDSVAPTTRDRVIDTANRLGYRLNALARGLSSRTSDMVAVMIPDIANPFFGSLVKGVQTAALAHGLVTLVCDTGADAEQERVYLDALLARQVRHVFVVGLTLRRSTVSDYMAAGVNFIALDRPMQNASSVVVRSDNRAGGELAVAHLLGLGHHRIAHISGPPNLPQSRHRKAGYVKALAAAGLHLDEQMLVNSDFSEEGGAAAFHELDRRGAGFTAIFAADDVIAMGAMSAAASTGRQVPADLSIVGFDDVLPARYTTPPLTTVRQDAMAMAARAVQLISVPEETRRHSPVVLPVALVIRGSTAPLNRSAGTSRRKHGAADRRH